MKVIKFFSKLVLILVLSSIPLGQARATSANDFYFKDATFDYYLEPTDSGSKMHVKEVLTAVFPETNQNHGITRAVPYSNQDGKNLTVPSESALNLTVKRNGEEEPISKSEKEDGYYIFYIGRSSSYVHGEQVYTLEYDFENVITEFTASGAMTWENNQAAFQELYWDTNGTGWSQKFNSLTANLHLPADIAKNLETGTSCYVGRYGASDNGSSISSRCEVSSSDETTYNSNAKNATSDKTAETVITFETSNLAAGENLTFATVFKPNTFVVPKPKESYLLVIITAIEALIAGAIVVITIIKYQKTTKDKKAHDKSLFVKPEYIPPKNFTVAESGEIYLKSKKSSFVATVLELAISRKIEIGRVEKDGLLKNKEKWKIKINNLDDITEWQLAVLKILNGGLAPSAGESFEIKKHAATPSLERLKKSYHSSAIASLTKKGLFEAKEKSIMSLPSLLLLFALFIAIPIIFGISSEVPNLVGELYLTIASILILIIAFVVVVIMSISGSKYTKRTIKGIEMSKYLEGLKLYIEMAEKDRIKFLQSVKNADTSAEGIVKLYERLLPYACLFGLEDSWMEELSKYYKEHPEIEHNWYYGTDYFTMSMFHSMITSTSSTIISSTSYSSSSSSGGGGGGFSGGGGGGGGGGGW